VSYKFVAQPFVDENNLASLRCDDLHARTKRVSVYALLLKAFKKKNTVYHPI